MDYEAALIARVRTDSGVTAIIGNRSNWDERPQASGLPALTFQTVTDERAQHLKGYAGMQEVTVQADIWAATSVQRRAAREAVIAALVPPTVVDGISFRRAEVTARAGSEKQGEQTIYRASLDFTFRYSAAN